MAPLSHTHSAGNIWRLRKFQCALFQNGIRVELARLARKMGLSARLASDQPRSQDPIGDDVVIRDDNFNFRWFTKQMSAELVGKKGAIPEVGERSPETGFSTLCERSENSRGTAGTSTKIRESCDGRWTEDWPTACTIRKSWTHSDRRLSQVCERGGRGLLKDECWSFPPASEREARMDDPTPRSKKGRETECVLGGSCSQARAPIFF